MLLDAEVRAASQHSGPRLIDRLRAGEINPHRVVAMAVAGDPEARTIVRAKRVHLLALVKCLLRDPVGRECVDAVRVRIETMVPTGPLGWGHPTWPRKPGAGGVPKYRSLNRRSYVGLNSRREPDRILLGWVRMHSPGFWWIGRELSRSFLRRVRDGR